MNNQNKPHNKAQQHSKPVLLLYDTNKMNNTDTNEMTVQQMQKGIVDYEKKIDKTRDDILVSLHETENLSNHIGNELNEQTESLHRIDDELDMLDHKITISETLVKRFAGWFSFLRSPPVISEITDITPSDLANKQRITTKFEPSEDGKTDLTTSSTNKKTKHSQKEFETEEERLKAEEDEKIQKEKEFYDQVFKSLDKLGSDAETYGKIMNEQTKVIDALGDKVDKSDARLKKNTDKVKRF